MIELRVEVTYDDDTSFVLQVTAPSERAGRLRTVFDIVQNELIELAGEVVDSRPVSVVPPL